MFGIFAIEMTTTICTNWLYSAFRASNLLLPTTAKATRNKQYQELELVGDFLMRFFFFFIFTLGHLTKCKETLYMDIIDTKNHQLWLCHRLVTIAFHMCGMKLMFGYLFFCCWYFLPLLCFVLTIGNLNLIKITIRAFFMWLMLCLWSFIYKIYCFRWKLKFLA